MIYEKSRCMAPPARLELTTLRLGGVRSIQVSYGGIAYILLKHICPVKKISFVFYKNSKNTLYRIIPFGYNKLNYANTTK